MGLSDKIVEILITAAVVALVSTAGLYELYKENLVERKITMPLGEFGTLFSFLTLTTLSAAIIAYLILWSIRRRKVVM